MLLHERLLDLPGHESIELWLTQTCELPFKGAVSASIRTTISRFGRYASMYIGGGCFLRSGDNFLSTPPTLQRPAHGLPTAWLPSDWPVFSTQKSHLPLRKESRPNQV